MNTPMLGSLSGPWQHKASVMVYWGALALAFFGNILGQLLYGAESDLASTMLQVILAILIPAFFVFFWQKGHLRARSIMTFFAVFAAMELVSFFVSLKDTSPDPQAYLLSILGTPLFITATMLAWHKDVSAYLNAKKTPTLHT